MIFSNFKVVSRNFADLLPFEVVGLVRLHLWIFLKFLFISGGDGAVVAGIVNLPYEMSCIDAAVAEFLEFFGGRLPRRREVD